MCIKVNSNFNSIKSSLTENKKMELLEIRYFQLDQDACLSRNEIENLPESFKDEINELFFKVLNKSELKKEASKISADCISIKVEDGKLVYKFNGEKNFKTLQDEKIQKTFQKLSKNIKKYLQNVGDLKEKPVKLSKIDKKIIETAPDNIEKVSKEAFKKMKKSDSEWSLWAIWACEIKEFFVKFCSIFGIKWDSSIIPEGVDSILGYLFSGYGIVDGIESQRDCEKINDIEGQKNGKHTIFRNILALLGSAFDAISKMMVEGTHILVTLCLSIAATLLFFITSVYSTLKYAWLYFSAKAFQKKFNKYIQNEKLNKEQKVIAALKYLKNKISVTNKEAGEILRKIKKQNPTLSDYKITKLVHEEISKKVLTKINRFERRVGEGVFSSLQKEIDEILKNPTIENIKKGQLLLNKIQCQNEKIISENKWYAPTSALAALEIAALYVFGFTTLAALAGCLSAAITIILLGVYFYKKHININLFLNKSSVDEKSEFLDDRAKNAAF